ncbi:MAG: glycosyltransferase family 39 protein [Candidatus Parcubacteria bacterium]|nr:glycosyltransferase family 39 protein [Candidatus Parcubacteria bacterium]
MNKFVEKNISLLIFLLIILIAVFLRFNKLGLNPPSLDWDEASIGYNAYSILQTGADEYGNKFPLSIRSFDDYKPPIYVYLAIPSIAVFGLTEFAVRLPAALIGIAAVVVVYFFVKEILYNWDKNKREHIALASAFFLAISPWHLQFSRAAFEGNVGMFFLILSLLFFFKGLKNKYFYLPFAAAFVLSIYSYHSFRLISPILLLVLLALFYKQLVKQKILIIISLIIIVILSAATYVSFFSASGAGARLSMVTVFSDPTLQMKSAKNIVNAKKSNNFIGEILNNRRVIFIPTIVRGYFDHFNFDFLFVHGDGGVQHHAYNMGMLYLWDFPFIILGIVFLSKKINRRIFLLFILFLLAPIPAAITTGTPHPVRAIAMIPGFQIFSSAGFILTLSMILQKKYKPIGIVIALIVIICLASNVKYYLESYYVNTPIKYGYFWQYGYKEALTYAKTNESKFKNIVMTYEYDQPYIYYLFYNKINPKWYQENWDYNKNGKVDRFQRVIGKYTFKNIEYSKDINISNALLIGTSREIPENAKVIKTIKYLDGKIAFKIVKT